MARRAYRTYRGTNALTSKLDQSTGAGHPREWSRQRLLSTLTLFARQKPERLRSTAGVFARVSSAQPGIETK